MNIDEMIAVLKAAKRGEEIQWLTPDDLWVPWRKQQCNFVDYHYRIAPKKEMTLVDELRSPMYVGLEICAAAANRIEALEKLTLFGFTTDELLAEIARRVK